MAPFFKQYCVKCHGPEKQKGKLRLDTLEPAFDSLSVAERWVEILDNLNAGEMPPEEEPQPKATQQNVVVRWIEKELAQAGRRRQGTGGRIVLRRLNRREYNNTVRSLTGIDFDAGRDFPDDPPAHGFDNIGGRPGGFSDVDGEVLEGGSRRGRSRLGHRQSPD